jgi:16S rRNA processing protein RimM
MKYVEIGKIINTHALKGELKVASDSDFIEERIGIGSKVYIRQNQDMVPLEVTSARMHGNGILVTFNHLANINLVQHLVGQTLFVPRDSLSDLDENEYYYSDLIGLKVYSTQNEYLGEVNDILEYPHGEILEIYNGDKKILIPFVEAFIKDVTGDKIFVEVIEGLI